MAQRKFVITQPVRETLEMIAATANFHSGVWVSGRPYRARAEYIERLEQVHFIERTPDGLLCVTEAGRSEALRSIQGAR